MTVRPVQGAYMLGEETVLIKALEGKRGQPDQRPPYPTEKGLFDRPTVVNNVQTLAAVPWIMVNGREAFAAIGAASSPGTVLVQLRGPEGGGIAEVPLGTPLRELVRLAGGTGSRELKAVLVGGPTGGLLPPDLLDTPYEFDALREAGAHMGSGSVVIADERACIVDLARLLTKFSADAACGKSIPCRIGLRRLYEIGDRIASGAPEAHGPGPAGRPRARHRGLGAVRPRAAGHPALHQRDAILPVRARRPPPSLHLPGRRLHADRGGRRCDRSRIPLMADLIIRPETPLDRPREVRPDTPRVYDTTTPREDSLAEQLITTQSPQRPQSTPRIRIEVDGRVVEGFEGQTILEVCRDNDIEIPTLCYEPKLPGFGACRMCVVEVEGEDQPPISCSRAAEPDMVVRTQTDELRRIRKTNLELIFSDHNAYCLPPCQNKCPSHIDIPGFLKANAEAEWRESVRIFKRTIPFPSVLGRVCPAPCEEHCRRDEVDEAIAIRDSHRYAGDQVIKAMLDEGIDPPLPFEKQAPSGRRAAVIGSGPAGMSAAYYLLPGPATT